MPFYPPVTMGHVKLEQKRKSNACAVCGGWLNIFLDNDPASPHYGQAFIACNDWSRTRHEGIQRAASRYQQRGMETLTIEARRDILNKEFGENKTTALEKYQGVTSLAKPEAREILLTLWPNADKASPAEFYKAMLLCTQYGLNPLMRHLFLIPFYNTEKKRYEHVCVQGITSNRLIASRKHTWTFLDDTPRIGSEAEEIKHYGKVNPDILRVIVKMRDIDTGAEVTAWGEWPMWKTDKQGKRVPNEPKGVDKGNSMMNMGCIHAERKGLDMLYPADMPPSDIPVADEHFIDAESRVLPDEVSPPDAEIEEVGQEPPDEQIGTDEKAARDPDGIKDFGGLYTACQKDWPKEFQTRQKVWQELGVSGQEELSDTPADCYRQIAAART